MIKKIFIVSVVITILLTSGLSLVKAAPTYIPLEPLPCIPGNGITCSNGAGNPTGPNQNGAVDFRTYIQYIFNLAIAIAAASAVFMITYGGFQYMTTESWTGKGDSLEKIKNAIFGLILVLASYLILRTVDPRLVAIPTTLVAPLNITNRESSLDSFDRFMGQLQADATRYRADMAVFQEAARTARAGIASSNGRIAAIDEELNSIVTGGDEGRVLTEEEINEACNSTTDPELSDRINALCAERMRLTDNVASTTQNLNLNVAMGLMRATVQHCGSTTAEPACFDGIGQQANLTEIFNRYVGQIQPNKRVQLGAYFIFAKSWFIVNKEISKYRRFTSGFGAADRASWMSLAIPNTALMSQAAESYSSTTEANPIIIAEMREQSSLTTTQVTEITAFYNTPIQDNN